MNANKGKANPGGNTRRGVFKQLFDNRAVVHGIAGGDDVLNIEIDDLDLRILKLLHSCFLLSSNRRRCTRSCAVYQRVCTRYGSTSASKQKSLQYLFLIQYIILCKILQPEK